MKKVKIAILVILFLVAAVLGISVWLNRPAIALRGQWAESGNANSTLQFYKDGTLVRGEGKKKVSTQYKLLDDETLQIGSTVYKFQIENNSLVFTDGEWKYRKFIKQKRS